MNVDLYPALLVFPAHVYMTDCHGRHSPLLSQEPGCLLSQRRICLVPGTCFTPVYYSDPAEDRQHVRCIFTHFAEVCGMLRIRVSWWSIITGFWAPDQSGG